MIKSVKNRIEVMKLRIDIKRYKKWKKEYEQELRVVEFKLDCVILTPEERKVALYKADGLRNTVRYLKLKIDECILEEVKIIRGDK